MYESFNDLTTVNKQHMVEWFTGNALNTDRWNETTTFGSATFAMNDSVDGGFRISTSGNGEGMINFNNKRNFSETGCVAIWTARDVQTTSYSGYYGLANGITGNNADMGQLAVIFNSSMNDVIGLRTGNTTKGNTYASDSTDTDWHVYKIEMKSSSAEWSIDGVAQTTRTSTLPTLALQPVAGIYGNGKSIDLRYCEAYNT